MLVLLFWHKERGTKRHKPCILGVFTVIRLYVFIPRIHQSHTVESTSSTDQCSTTAPPATTPAPASLLFTTTAGGSSSTKQPPHTTLAALSSIHVHVEDRKASDDEGRAHRGWRQHGVVTMACPVHPGDNAFCVFRFSSVTTFKAQGLFHVTFVWFMYYLACVGMELCRNCMGKF